MSDRSSFLIFKTFSLNTVMDLIQNAGLGFDLEVKIQGSVKMAKKEFIFIDQYAGGKASILVPSTAFKFNKICNKVLISGRDVIFCVRIQEGTIWEYSLYRNCESKDTFSVSPNFWEGDSIDHPKYERWRGNPRLVGDLWDIPIHRIERYLIDWGLRIDETEGNLTFAKASEGKAYEQDEFAYGDVYQAHDFIQALGGIIPDVETRRVMYIE